MNECRQIINLDANSYYLSRGISLELGGKSPLIVFEDAHVDAAVDWIITGFLWGSGQVYRKKKLFLSIISALIHISLCVYI